jgi:hypothetical protein
MAVTTDAKSVADRRAELLPVVLGDGVGGSTPVFYLSL